MAPRLNPDQFRESESKDYTTGRAHLFAEIEVGEDRLPHEPHSIRASAREVGPGSWSTEVIHGPHDERDETGSYYRTVTQGSLGSVNSRVSASKVKPTVRRLVKQAHAELLAKRGE